MSETPSATGALDELRAVLPDHVLSTDEARREAYRYDWTRIPGSGLPMAVVRAETTEQVQSTLRWASAHSVPVVPRGAGTGLAGGASGLEGCVVLSTERMTQIEVDPATQTARAGAGALNAAVKKATAEHGLWYPPDPSSFEICSVGGNVATNAGGLCCVKYGVTRDYVLGLEVVLADGTLLQLGGPLLKDVAGLSLLHLFIGSEGTLGVITQVTLRLVPSPEPFSTLVAWFPTVRAAAETVVAIRQRLRPSMLELMDQPSVRAVEELQPMGLDVEAGALLLARSDAPGHVRADDVALMTELCNQHGATEVHATDDPAEGEMMAAARRASLQALEVKGTCLLEDMGVPVPLLPDLFDSIDRIAERHGVEIPTVAHAGDGNSHPVIVYDPTDDDARLRALAAFDDLMAAAIAMGGTITGEHGVGRMKSSALPAQLGEDVMDVQRRIKAALDPAGLLNPGAMLG